MPVIGRLDKQVSKLLIEPLDKQRPADETQTPEPPRHTTPQPTQRPSASTPHERADDARELPVWLL
ncbi:MAG: hypothetical protein LC754_07850 [Acidobacteria bacterium]|nr:hypothetical protein [Acidobacteriota bacterium]